MYMLNMTSQKWLDSIYELNFKIVAAVKLYEKNRLRLTDVQDCLSIKKGGLERIYNIDQIHLKLVRDFMKLS